MSKIKILDLFAGAGGLSYSFHNNDKFDVVLANEIDEGIAKIYSYNFPKTEILVKDIKNAKLDIQQKLANEKIDVILGGPPCQGFSTAGKRNRTTNKNNYDYRNYLFRDYFDIIKMLKPTFFFIENVPGILNIYNGEILNEIKNLTKINGYNFFYKIINMSDFYIPQNRKRFIFIGYNNKLKEKDFENIYDNASKLFFKNSPYSKKNNIRDAISDLNFNEETFSFNNIYRKDPESLFQNLKRNKEGKVFNHLPTNHKKHVLDRIKILNAGENYKNLENRIKSVHSGSYGRMEWNNLSSTIVTRFDTPSGGRFIHPELNRTITQREAARLQSFSDDYIFIGNKTTINTAIGNAVPPDFSIFVQDLITIFMERLNEKENKK